ncbi:alpha-1,2-fucosyltransferase [Larkinella sp. VNQ87]|uniref:alpha-1,2-fucosyltransferase n=1 Tax=Larkinella sp. VNQ87 TaxID=3400921 RepID=UPI003C09F440
MVISCLMGGLGNQLFQYAFGLRLAHDRQTDLKLSTTLLESRLMARLRNYTLRPYELDVFNLTIPCTSSFETALALAKATSGASGSVFLRETPNLTPNLPTLNPSAPLVFCWGYWQSEAWFKPVAPLLRQQLRFRKPLSDASQRYADAIARARTPVFLHVRRGDYVTNANARQLHGFAGETYYRNAIERMREQVEEPHFFVFSDELLWVKTTLGPLLNPATYVEGNTGSDSWQDLALMSQCRHAIVANSSFSWWGAWLNPAENRLVLAPRQWFVSAAAQTKVVVPEQWTLL